MSILRNAGYSAIGVALPSVLTLVTVPLYLRLVGAERLGVLTLCWLILGYSGVLDIFTIAVARTVASIRGDEDGATDVVWTSLWLALGIGILGSALLLGGATFYFSRLATIGGGLQRELLPVLPVIALMVPFILMSGVLSGALQGKNQFQVPALAGVLSNSLFATLPLLIAVLVKPTMFSLIAGGAAGRLLPFPWLLLACARELRLGHVRPPSRLAARTILGFGSWVGAGTVFITLINTVDRLLIGARLGAALVPTYAIPYGLVSRVMIVSHGLSPALLPRLAAAADDPDERNRLTAGALQTVATLITLPIVLLIACAEILFPLWIGRPIGRDATAVAYVLAPGFWCFCVAHIASSSLQALGRPRLISRVLALELPLFVLLLLAGIGRWGVLGAAGAFSIRALVDCAIFLRLLGTPGPVLRLLLVQAAAIAASLSVVALTHGMVALALNVVVVAATAAWSWRHLPPQLSSYRDRIRGRFGR